jgi:hypothetical protein
MNTNKDQQSKRDSSDSLTGSGPSSDSMRNAEPKPSDGRSVPRDRTAQDDLILHDDDEAELELPR